MEGLVIILLAVGSFIWHAIQKRKQEAEEAKPWLPPMPKGNQPAPNRPVRPISPQPPQQQQPRSWEEELRRLLEGETTQPESPPVIVPSPAPPPIPRTTSGQSRPMRPPPTMADEVDPMEVGLPVTMPGLTQSAEAWQRAGNLDIAVAERLRLASEQVVKHHAILARREGAPEIKRALGLLRDRSSQRAAIVASVALGPPKALDN